MAINHKNFAQTTLGAAIESVDGTSITVTSEAGFPAVDFIISIDTEAMLVTNVSTTTWTVTRGYEGSTAATHLNGAAIFHDWSAGEADSTVHGPASATDVHLAVFDGATGKLIKDGGAVPAAGLPTTGGTLTGNLIMDNMDITLVKLLTLHGEIDDGNSGIALLINWNAGGAQKSTLTGNATISFSGITGIPTMTTDTAPSGVASASNETYDLAFHAFDNEPSSNWEPATLPGWLQYQFSTAVVVVSYTLAGRSDNCSPRTWVLQGSNNGTDFTTLDTQTGITFAGTTPQTFSISNSAAYSYYRLYITVANGSYACVSSMTVSINGIVDPTTPCFLNLKVTQDATGGRLVTWPSSVKGTPLYDLAADAVTVIQFYWDGSSYWLSPQDRRVSVPASATAKGMAGQWSAEGSYFYYCSATDTWVRTALATWS